MLTPTFRFKSRIFPRLCLIFLCSALVFYLNFYADNKYKLDEKIEFIKEQQINDAPKAINAPASPRPPDENVPAPELTKTSLKSKAEDLMKNTVVLSTTNSGYLDIVINWLESIKKLNINPNIILIAEDEDAYDKLQSYNNASTTIRKGKWASTTNKSKLIYDTIDYKKLVYRRPKYIYDELQKGKNVFFCDADTYWLKDPFPYFVGDFDMVLQQDYIHDNWYCAGIVYFRHGKPASEFVGKWVNDVNKESLDSNVNEEDILNKLINSNSFGLKMKIMNLKEFPHGRYYFNDNRIDGYDEAVIVHNNWVIGPDAKVNEFKKFGLWLTDNL